MPDQTSNERLFDALVRHQVGLQRLSPGVTADVLRLLDASQKDLRRTIEDKVRAGLSTKRLEGVLRTIEEIRDDSWTGAISEWNSQLIEVVKAEPLFLDAVVQKVVPVVLQTAVPSADQMASILQTAPFQGRVFGTWVESMRIADIQRIEDAIKIGLTQGGTGDEIAARVLGTAKLGGTDGVLQITRNNAAAITRTAVTAITNQARQDYYADNDDVFDRELFIAVLDARTTIVCASHDGKIYEAGEGPVPPLHWNCRSQRVGVMDDEAIGQRPTKDYTTKQLLREFAEQEDLDVVTTRDALPRGTKTKFDEFSRARVRELTGQAPATLTYHDWLSRQSAAFQDDVLGPARGKLFRENGVTLDKFVNRAGDVLTLAQLRDLDIAGLED